MLPEDKSRQDSFSPLRFEYVESLTDLHFVSFFLSRLSLCLKTYLVKMPGEVNLPKGK